MKLYVSSFHTVSRGGSWTPSTINNQQWLEIRIHYTPVAVRSIRTQGAHDRDEWVTKYELLYRTSYRGVWQKAVDSEGNTV